MITFRIFFNLYEVLKAKFSFQNSWNLGIICQINLRGLDGIQGPVYVGTGCVFRRRALYGYDPPKKIKPPSRSCNCWSSLCCCIGLGPKAKKSKVNIRPKFWKKRRQNKKSEADAVLNKLEDIEGGFNGINNMFQCF